MKEKERARASEESTQFCSRRRRKTSQSPYARVVASYQFNRSLMNGQIGFLKVPVSLGRPRCPSLSLSFLSSALPRCGLLFLFLIHLVASWCISFLRCLAECMHSPPLLTPSLSTAFVHLRSSFVTVSPSRSFFTVSYHIDSLLVAFERALSRDEALFVPSSPLRVLTSFGAYISLLHLARTFLRVCVDSLGLPLYPLLFFLPRERGERIPLHSIRCNTLPGGCIHL